MYRGTDIKIPTPPTLPPGRVPSGVSYTLHLHARDPQEVSS